MTDISTRAKRERLAKRRAPHFQKLTMGVYLGWRATSDTWIGRVQARDSKQHYKPLELPLNLPAGGEFDAAKELCETFAASIRGCVLRSTKFARIGDVVTGPYFDQLRRREREEAIADATRDLRLCLLGDPRKGRAADPLAAVMLSEATEDDFLAWRDRIELLPIRPQSKNNYIKRLKAALNCAKKARYAGNPAAWGAIERFPVSHKDTERAAYLSREQRAALYAGCEATKNGQWLADFLRAIYEGGTRPVEAARAKVSDFDAKRGIVTWYTRKGRCHEFRPYFHKLTPSGVALFRRLSQGKPTTAPLLTTHDGESWERRKWGRLIAEARLIANRGRTPTDPLYLPALTRAYSFRHSKITDMIEIGREDATKVAILCGTSVDMIKKTYLHLLDRPNPELDKLAA